MQFYKVMVCPKSCLIPKPLYPKSIYSFCEEKLVCVARIGTMQPVSFKVVCSPLWIVHPKLKTRTTWRLINDKD